MLCAVGLILRCVIQYSPKYKFKLFDSYDIAGNFRKPNANFNPIDFPNTCTFFRCACMQLFQKCATEAVYGGDSSAALVNIQSININTVGGMDGKERSNLNATKQKDRRFQPSHRPNSINQSGAGPNCHVAVTGSS